MRSKRTALGQVLELMLTSMLNYKRHVNGTQAYAPYQRLRSEHAYSDCLRVPACIGSMR